MSPENHFEEAKYIKCIHCGRPLVRENPNEPFFYCRGYKKFTHPLFLVSSQLDSEDGKLKSARSNDKIQAAER